MYELGVSKNFGTFGKNYSKDLVYEHKKGKRKET